MRLTSSVLRIRLPSLLRLSGSPAGAASGTASEYPEQLELLHAELDRERDEIAGKLGQMYGRASVLVAAAGVITALTAKDWVSAWQLVSIGLYFVAALLGLAAMRPQKAGEPYLAGHFDDVLVTRPYAARFTLVNLKLASLEARTNVLTRVAWCLSTGYIVLTLAWLSSVIIVLLDRADVI